MGEYKPMNHLVEVNPSVPDLLPLIWTPLSSTSSHGSTRSPGFVQNMRTFCDPHKESKPTNESHYSTATGRKENGQNNKPVEPSTEPSVHPRYLNGLYRKL